MDTNFWQEAGKYGLYIAMLLGGLRVTWLRMMALEAARDKRDEAERAERVKRESESKEECSKQNAELGSRLRKLEDDTRADMRADKAKLLECIHRSTRAFEIIAEKLPIDPPSGMHPTQGG